MYTVHIAILSFQAIVILITPFFLLPSFLAEIMIKEIVVYQKSLIRTFHNSFLTTQ